MPFKCNSSSQYSVIRKLYNGKHDWQHLCFITLKLYEVYKISLLAHNLTGIFRYEK